MATIDLTSENFNETLNSAKVVIVEVFAPWCGHCRQFTPTFKKISDNYPDIIFGMVNTDEQRELAKEHDVSGVPTVIGFVNGMRVHSNAGVLSEEKFEEFIKKVISSDPESEASRI